MKFYKINRHWSIPIRIQHIKKRRRNLMMKMKWP